MRFLLIASFITFSLFFSCKEAGPLENALDKAGENRKELFAVLEHYGKVADDSLKLEAAKFLIAHMAGHYTLDSRAVREMQRRVQQSDTVITDKRTLNYWWKELDEKPAERKAYPDLQTVTAAFLIDNIDAAFRAWDDSPWQKEVSFDDFCNYILPYRMNDEALAMGWRDSLRRQYAPVIEGVTGMRRAFVLLRDTMWERTRRENPEFPYVLDMLTMRKQGVMTCMQGCAYLGAVARALGLPVVCDGVFQWANYSNMGHNWVALTYGGHTYTALDGDSVAREFNQLDASTFPELYKLEADYPLDASLEKRAAKVWRFAYRQKENPVTNKKLARALRFVGTEDVSAQYGFQGEVSLPVGNEAEDVCLCIYSSGGNWFPIDCTQVKKGKVRFCHLNDSIVYQVMTFRSDTLSPLGHPFLLLPNGHRDLIPDKQQSETVTLTRKYPFSRHWTNQWGRMKGGYFEAANDSMFRQADRLCTLEAMPVFRNEFMLPGDKAYRYVRYVSAPGSNVPIMELAFYSGDNILQGRAFGAKMEAPERAFDGDTFTLIYSQQDGYSVGMDFGAPQRLTRLELFPKNDGNFVVPGHVYELRYYDEGWHTLGKQTSTGFFVTFPDVPCGSLLLLKDCTEGKEERIFTYEADRQRWW